MEPKEQELQLKYKTEQVEKLKDMLRKVLNFYHMDTKEWVDKYGPGLTTKQLGDEIRITL